jgi:hypothetical protein
VKSAELIFIYNAKSDLFSTVSDFAHKIISPSTYSCNLCALTFGSFAVKQEWKSFIQNLPVKTRFLHKEAFQKEFKLQTALPAVFIKINGKAEQIIDSDEIENCETLEDLKKIVVKKLEKYV